MGVDVNERSSKGFSALHLACTMGRDDVVRTLVELGAEVDAIDNEGRKKNRDGERRWRGIYKDESYLPRLLILLFSGLTPLHQAAAKDMTEKVRLLAEVGADVNLANEYGIYLICFGFFYI
jgi:ankyrin repeat protein